MNRAYRIIFLVVFTLTFTVNLLKANDGEAVTDVEANKGFDAGTMIIEHISDAYEWHIATIGEFQLSVPLPVILFSKSTGLHVFMSGKLYDGEKVYQGFKISKEGKYEGKIVEIADDNQEIRPIDISITKNVLSLFIGIILLLWIFLKISNRYSKNPSQPPKGLQSWLEPVIIFIRDDVAIPNIGVEKYQKYLPFILTIFFFILINNLLGLLPVFPGGANLTGNIAVTMVLALFTFVVTSFSGTKSYWVHMVNAPGVPWWLKFPIPLMPIVEIMSMFLKPFVLMIRLFANIAAGHIIALGFYSLIFIFGQKSISLGYGVSVVSIAFTIFMGLLELLVVFIQAYVFALLSALYIGMAIENQEEGHNQTEKNTLQIES